MPRGYYHRRVRRHAVVQPLDPTYRLIALTRGQNAIVDAEDFDWLSQWNWYAAFHKHNGSFYATRSPGSRKCGTLETIKMHRVIMEAQHGEEVDHRNLDTLDNRKANLRKCTSQQNSFNRKPHRGCEFKGIFFDHRRGVWYAYLRHSGKQVFGGTFESAMDAARAYDKMALDHFGEFAFLNFPQP